MQRRPLGSTARSVSAVGLGCMGMSEFYGPTDDRESLDTLELALELGIDFLDTADMYGPHTNEELLGRFLAGRRNRVTLATKFGIVRSVDPNARGVDNRPEYIRRSLEGSLRRLGTEWVDLYYVHRVDRAIPIEETVGVLADLVTAGKVRAIGLSEVSAATLRRAHAVHPIAGVQSEYSLFTRDPERNGVLAAVRELGITFVAYSPLGRGLLGAPTPPLAADDFRRRLPRFQGDALTANQRLAGLVHEIGARIGSTSAQVALAWLLSRSDSVVPIPGTRQRSRLRENAAAVDLRLDAETLAALDSALPPSGAIGNRYAQEGMSLLDA